MASRPMKYVAGHELEEMLDHPGITDFRMRLGERVDDLEKLLAESAEKHQQATAKQGISCLADNWQ